MVASAGSGASKSAVRDVATTCCNQPEELLDALPENPNSCIFFFRSLKGSTGRRVWSSEHTNPVCLKPGLGSSVMKPRTPSIATSAFKSSQILNLVGTWLTPPLGK